MTYACVRDEMIQIKPSKRALYIYIYIIVVIIVTKKK